MERPDILRAEVEAFLNHEARLLDESRYDEWVALYTEDCRYWAPVSRAMQSPHEGPSHFNDDMQLMQARVHRLANPRVFAAEPGPRTAHIVSGVTIDRAGDTEIVASSSQLMLEHRPRGGYDADLRMFGGRVTHVLRREDGALRIALKRIDLVNAEGPFNAMTAPL